MKRSLVMVLAILFVSAGAVVAQESEVAPEMPAMEQSEEAVSAVMEEAPAMAEAAESEMQDIESSLIKEVGYDAATKALTVIFLQSEEKYLYKDVPEDIYAALMAAESKGKFEFTKE